MFVQYKKCTTKEMEQELLKEKGIATRYGGVVVRKEREELQ